MKDYEQELRRVTIGEPQRVDGPIHLADYDPAWPDAFAREAVRIRHALGERTLVVEHAGSTSVPGLAAKPRIDIVLAVPDSADESAYVRDMEAAGYTLRIREPEWHEHRLFKGPDTDINLHVFTVGCSEIERMLRFRDWLREHPTDRDLYLAEKQALAARSWEFVQQYADAKGELVESILARSGAPPASPNEREQPLG
jgi:GrpB-like predicted nucleotidyltransferase (UPF0157 family)